MATKISDFWEVIQAHLPKGIRLSLDEIYEVVEANLDLDSEDFEPASPDTDSLRWKRNVRNTLQARKQTGEIIWFEDAQYMIPIIDDLIEIERQNRWWIWEQLENAGGPTGISTSLIHSLRIYRGQAGIWRDTNRTALITDDDGIAVGFLHTGEHYPDDLTSEGVLYHYPETDRVGSTDLNEINSAKNTGLYQLPIFVVVPNEENEILRDVKVGYILGWDDIERTFTVKFTETKPEKLEIIGVEVKDESEFILDGDEPPGKLSTVRTRPGQAEFKRDVFERYGACCAVCDIEIVEMLDAAHIKSKRCSGSDDPRNGLVLCASHHRAMDADLFRINPDSLMIVTHRDGPSSDDLMISKEDITHLNASPHIEAISWLWTKQEPRSR